MLDFVVAPETLFRSTAPFYARFRAGYPSQLFEALVTRFGLDGTDTVLDLGCGTGQLALPLAPHASLVLAVDPEPDMLAEGEALAREQQLGNIRWLQGDSYRLPGRDLPGLMALSQVPQRC